MNASLITDFLKQHKPSKSASLFIGGCALGLALGTVLFALLPSYNPPDDDAEAASVVFERIVKQNELVSVSQRYSITDKAKDSNSFFDLFDIPFTENSFWYRYAGTIKAGVNLQTAAFELDGTTVHITLDEPYVISNTPDMDESGVLEESNNILNPIHVEDVDAFQKKCQEDSQQYSVKAGLLDEAKANAEADLRGMFNAALGDRYSVEFTYRTDQQRDVGHGEPADDGSDANQETDSSSGEQKAVSDDAAQRQHIGPEGRQGKKAEGTAVKEGERHCGSRARSGGARLRHAQHLRAVMEIDGDGNQITDRTYPNLGAPGPMPTNKLGEPELGGTELRTNQQVERASAQPRQALRLSAN